jgi:uncharacterized protein (DUF58 family)
MSFAGGEHVSKLSYGSFLAAALSYLMLKQNDSTSLILFNETITERLPPKSRRTHLNAILTALEKNKASGRTNLTAVLHTVAETTKRRGLVILISDLLDDEQDIHEGLAHLKYLNHDVLIFHTLDRMELELEYEGLVQFEDMESNSAIRAFPRSVQDAYRQQVTEFVDDVEKTAGRSGIEYCLLNTSEPLDKALITYLAKRRRMP